MTCKEAKELVKSRLGEKRYRHTLNVKKMAVALAERWGADPEKAALAALLHDSAKELPKSELLQIFQDNVIIANNAAQRPAPVWHGLAAAILCQTQWGVTDPEGAPRHPVSYHRQGGNEPSGQDHLYGRHDQRRAGFPRCRGTAQTWSLRTSTWLCAPRWNTAFNL